MVRWRGTDPRIFSFHPQVNVLCAHFDSSVTPSTPSYLHRFQSQSKRVDWQLMNLHDQIPATTVRIVTSSDVRNLESLSGAHNLSQATVMCILFCQNAPACHDDLFPFFGQSSSLHGTKETLMSPATQKANYAGLGPC